MRPITIFAALLLLLSFTFQSCVKDSCDGNACFNNGVCIDGTCDCPDNFTGPSCSEQVTPIKIRVTGVSIERFPGYAEDREWNPDGPDIYFRLLEDGQPLAQPIVPIENAMSDQDYNFAIVPFDLQLVTSNHTMELFDFKEAGVPPEKLGEVNFTPYHSTNGFPKTIILDDGGDVAFTVTVEYYFKYPHQD